MYRVWIVSSIYMWTLGFDKQSNNHSSNDRMVRSFDTLCPTHHKLQSHVKHRTSNRRSILHTSPYIPVSTTAGMIDSAHLDTYRYRLLQWDAVESMDEATCGDIDPSKVSCCLFRDSSTILAPSPQVYGCCVRSSRSRFLSFYLDLFLDLCSAYMIGFLVRRPFLAVISELGRRSSVWEKSWGRFASSSSAVSVSSGISTSLGETSSK